MAAGIDAVVIDGTDALIERVRLPLDLPAMLLAVTEKLKLPASSGVP